MKQIDHSTEYSYSGVGANIMRMCHQANDCDRAERMYVNQVCICYICEKKASVMNF